MTEKLWNSYVDYKIAFMFTHVDIMPSCTRVAIPITLEYYVRVTQECID